MPHFETSQIFRSQHRTDHWRDRNARFRHWRQTTRGPRTTDVNDYTTQTQRGNALNIQQLVMSSGRRYGRKHSPSSLRELAAIWRSLTHALMRGEVVVAGNCMSSNSLATVCSCSMTSSAVNTQNFGRSSDCRCLQRILTMRSNIENWVKCSRKATPTVNSTL